MQTDQLTTLTASLFGAFSPAGIPQSGTGQGSIDFGALLLSLLSLESVPLELEAPLGEEPELTGQGTANGAEGSVARVLLTALSAVSAENQPATPVVTMLFPGTQVPAPSVTNTEITNAKITDAIFATEFRVDPAAGLPQEQIEALLKAPEQRHEPNPLPAAVVPDREPLVGPIVTLQDEQTVTIIENTPPVTQPVIVDRKEGGIKVSDYRVELPQSPTGEVALPAVGIQSVADEGISGEYTARADILSTTPRHTATDLMQGKMNFMAAEPKPLFTAGEKQAPGPVVPLPVVSNANTQSVPLAPVIVAASGQQGVSATDIAALAPNAEIEMLKVPVEKRESTKAEYKVDTAGRPRTGTPTLTDRVTDIVGATVTKKQQEQPEAIIRLYQDSSGKEQAISQKNIITTTNGPELPGGMEIKSRAVRIQVDQDLKPATTPVQAENSATAKAETSAGRSENQTRTQFVLEPETLRPPIKVPTEIRLRLVPEDLGVVKLHLRALENHLAARVIVQSLAARMAVEGNLSELQRTLADAGLVIDRFHVTVGHTAEASPTHPDADSQRRRYAFKPKTNRRYQAAAGIEKAEAAVSAPAGGGSRMGQYRLNMVA